MGNICPCFGGNDQSEAHDFAPIPTVDTTRTRSRSTTERSASNFQTILENASNGFLFTKTKYKDNYSPDSIDAIRSRIQSAKVDLASIETSPLIIRPTPPSALLPLPPPLNNNNHHINNGNSGGSSSSRNNSAEYDSNNNSSNNNTLNRQNVVRLLSDPINRTRTKDLESHAIGIVQIIEQKEAIALSYQQENLPLVSFSSSEK